jgi:hypothetical protein
MLACVSSPITGGRSINKLMDELATISLAEFDAEIRFAISPPAAQRRRDWRCWTS